jgi:hypothetical protein
MFKVDTPYEPATPIFRATGYDQRYMICCTEVHCVRVHWFGRSLLCCGEDECPACQESWQQRSVLYIAVLAPGGKRGLLELPLSCANRLESAFARENCCGRIICIKKQGSGMEVSMEFSDAPRDERVPAVEEDVIKDQLCRVHGLPRRAHFADLGHWQSDVKAVAKKKLQFALQQALSRDEH